MSGRRARVRKYLLLAYVGLHVAAPFVWLLTVGRKHPDLARERLRPGPGAKESLREDAARGLPPALAHYLLAALDVGRFHWSDTVPVRVQAVGLLGMGASMALIFWA